jgi:hypothetical protein
MMDEDYDLLEDAIDAIDVATGHLLMVHENLAGDPDQGQIRQWLQRLGAVGQEIAEYLSEDY